LGLQSGLGIAAGSRLPGYALVSSQQQSITKT